MIKHFRRLGFIEAISLLVLLFIAMPLKYMAGMPEAVRVVGSIHGVLFILYVLAATLVAKRLGWSIGKLVFAYVISSVPFGPFIFDQQLFSAEAGDQ